IDRAAAGFGFAEQAALPARPTLVRALGDGEDRLGRGMDTGAIGFDSVESSGSGERFELALIEQPRVDAPGEIVERFEPAFAVALVDQQFHRAFGDALELAERVAHR